MSYKKDFPIFNNKTDFHYLDTAATSQKPKVVIDSLTDYYTNFNGNAGRGSHQLAIQSKLLIEETRQKTAKFINASSEKEIVFTKNATEALNIIIKGYFANILKQGDEVIIGVSNHHANLVGWQEICNSKNATLKYIPVDENGDFDMTAYQNMLSENTKVVSFSSMVNATGVINDSETIIKLAKKYNALTVVDASQYIHHRAIDVNKLDCDFLVFSAHKIFATLGTGVLYGKDDILSKVNPLLHGGDMIEYVELTSATYKDSPNKFEGGTKNTAAIHSLKVAIDYIDSIGYSEIENYIDDLYNYAIQKLNNIENVIVYASKAKEKSGIIAFNLKDIHSHDTAHILNEYGVMVRSGHHCTQPLMKAMNIASCCRASFSIYNDKDDIDKLIIGIQKALEIFNFN